MSMATPAISPFELEHGQPAPGGARAGLGNIGEEGGKARIGKRRGELAGGCERCALEGYAGERRGSRLGTRGVAHDRHAAPFLQSAHEAAAVLAGLGAVALLVGGEIGCAGEIEEGRLLRARALEADLPKERGNGSVRAHLAQDDGIGAELGGDEMPGGAHEAGGIGPALAERVAVLADGLTHPAQQAETGEALAHERPQHHEPPLAAHGDDGERKARPPTRVEIVVGPMPAPVEGLERLGVAAGPAEEVVPFRLERIERGPLADDGDGGAGRHRRGAYGKLGRAPGVAHAGKPHDGNSRAPSQGLCHAQKD